MTDNSAGQGDLVIPGYRDFSLLGRGASSTVYRCHDEELNRWVAVKVFLADDPEDPQRVPALYCDVLRYLAKVGWERAVIPGCWSLAYSGTGDEARGR